MQQLRFWFAAGGVLALAMVAIAALSSGGTAEAGVTGGIHTTDVNCAGTDLNVDYGNKQDVYLEGGPKKPGASGLTTGDYGVEVTAPNGFLLGKSNGTVITADAIGEIPCAQLWELVYKASDGTQGYDDTTNNGNEYKVTICLNDDFDSSDCKSDNFKVDDEDAPPFDACVAHPGRILVDMGFSVKLGDPTVGVLVEESGPMAIGPVGPGTYLVTIQSWDDHIADGGDKGQKEEQWFARFFANGSLEAESGIIDDLPPDQDVINQQVGNVTFANEVDNFFARHALFGGPYPTADSIIARCVALDPVN